MFTSLEMNSSPRLKEFSTSVPSLTKIYMSLLNDVEQAWTNINLVVRFVLGDLARKRLRLTVQRWRAKKQRRLTIDTRRDSFTSFSFRFLLYMYSTRAFTLDVALVCCFLTGEGTFYLLVSFNIWFDLFLYASNILFE